MPIYEYYCPRCAAKFELLRPMSRIDEPATCPQGHGSGARTLSVFATATRDVAGESMPVPQGGGCGCGGACSCGGH